MFRPIDGLKIVLPFVLTWFCSGVAGSGVCILSRFPIHDVLFHQWPVNGYVHKLHHGDWFGGKGVGLCQIYYNDLLINVYTAHVSTYLLVYFYPHEDCVPLVYPQFCF